MSFIMNSALLGVGLAMDAFSVSVANGLNHPHMKKTWMLLIAGIFAFFQFIMPVAGWAMVHFLLETFAAIKPIIPWTALALLCFIGVKMIIEAMKSPKEGTRAMLTWSDLVIQGTATSIDALSVGFTIAGYGFHTALAASGIIAAVTFIMCFAGVSAGKRFGMMLTKKAGVIGGTILILIGIRIVLNGL